MTKPLLARVRASCLAYPESSERESHGSPAFFVRDKRCFATYLDNHPGWSVAYATPTFCVRPRS